MAHPPIAETTITVRNALEPAVTAADHAVAGAARHLAQRPPRDADPDATQVALYELAFMAADAPGEALAALLAARDVQGR